MTTIQVIVFFFNWIVIALIGYFIWRNRHKWIYAIPAYLYLTHVVIFYATLWLDNTYHFAINISAEAFNLWSTLIRLHGTVTILILTITLLEGITINDHD